MIENSRTHPRREIPRHVYYFIKTGDGFVNGTVVSTKIFPSSMPTSGLEIALLLKCFLKLCYK